MTKLMNEIMSCLDILFPPVFSFDETGFLADQVFVTQMCFKVSIFFLCLKMLLILWQLQGEMAFFLEWAWAQKVFFCDVLRKRQKTPKKG